MRKSIFKKSATLITLCAIMILSVFPAYAQNDTKQLLSSLEIMVGDANGNFNDNETLTREQFAKITVAIADPDYIAVNSVSPFFDVSVNRWSAGYIDRANQMGYFHGYPDGSFRPDEQIVPEQVCKVMLKLLGYDNENITGNWAMSQISFANNKGLLDGVNFEVGIPITRIEAAKIIENTLFSQLKDSDNYLAETMGYMYLEDVVLLSDKNAQAGYISTNQGTFKKSGNITLDSTGQKGSLLINKKNEIICFLSDEQAYEKYIVKTASGDSISVFGNKSAISGISDETLCYYGGQQTNFSQMKSLLKTGDNLTVSYASFGEIEYISASGNSMTAPKFIYNIPVNENTQYIRDGIKSSHSEIDTLDVCYFLENENTVVAYSKRVTGVFENAYPSKENVSTITVSGKNYTIGHTNASSRLSSSGNIQYGDTITLLFGKDDNVTDVVSLNDNDKIYGVVTGSYLKDRVDENGNRLSEYIVSIIGTDGSVSEFSASKDFSGYKGKVVAISFQNGLANISGTNTNNNISGSFNWSNKTLGKYKLSNDIDIVDVCYDSDYSSAKGKKIFPQRLNGVTFSANNILYACTEDGEITALFLNDYTGDLYDYGIVLYAKNTSSDYVVAGEYKVNINGSYSEFITQNRSYSISSGQPAKFEVDAAKGIIGIQGLTAVNSKVTELDELYAYTKGGKYLLADDVIIYHQIAKTGDSTGYRYEIISKDKINFENSVTAYYDKAEKSGGRIRVIVVK